MDGNFVHSLVVEKSSIEGDGLFSSVHIDRNESVAPILFEYNYDGKELPDHKKYYLRSDVLRFTNHNSKANCTPHRDGNIIYLRSNRDIEPSEEICVDYFDVIRGLDPYPNHFPYLKSELVRILPKINSAAFVKERGKSYIDDLKNFAFSKNGNPEIIKTFLELIKKLSI